MAFLKVLMSMTLLVVITLAEYPSQNVNTLENNRVFNEKKTIVDKSSYAENEGTPPKYRLPKNVIPTHYDISLTLDMEQLKKPDYKYTGSVNIMLYVKDKETKEIKLHFTNLISLTKTELLDPNTKPNESKPIKITGVERVEGTDINTLTLDTAITKDKNYTLKLVYEGVISDVSKGFYKGSYMDQELNEQWYVVTDFEPIGARNAFPCFDEPDLKATFSIKIKYNKGYKAISNMHSESIKVEGDTEETTFTKTPQMSTYLVAYAVTKFSKYEKDNVIVYSRPEVVDMTKTAAEIGGQVLQSMKNYTGIEYSVGGHKKMQQIALTSLKPSAMENWGLVTYRETSLLYDEKLNKTIDKQRVASIIAHELAHQWFGNLVTLKWWKHVWLNEGFATYFQYLIANKINQDWHFMHQFNVKCLQNALAYDAYEHKTRPLDYDETSEQEISSSFDTISYDKGASVIRMFSHVLKEDTFQKGLQNYLDTNKFKSVTSEELFEALTKVANKDNLPKDTDLPTVFKTWTSQNGYPVITVTVDRKDKDSSITITQEPFYLVKKNDTEKKSWYIPLNYVQQKDNSTFSDTSVQHWLKPGENLTIKEDVDVAGWVIFNVQQTGYYRVNYDINSWIILSKYLLNGDFATINPLNRAQLIDDAFNLAQAGYLNYDVTLKLVRYLEKETNYVVWKAALNGLSTLNKQLGLTDIYNDFLVYLKPIAQQLFNITSDVDGEKENYLTKLLRVDAIKWACAFGLDECKNYAVEQVRLALDPNSNVTLSQDLKKVTLCAAARHMTEDEWYGFFMKGMTQTDLSNDERSDMISSLGCSSSSEILKKFLDQLLHVEPLKMYFIETFETIYSNNPIGVQVVLEFLDKNLKQLTAFNHQFKQNLQDYLTEFASRVVSEKDILLLHNVTLASDLKDSVIILDIADRNMKWYDQYNDIINSTLTEINNPPPPPTTEKPNSSSSLTFTTVLITISLLLTVLQ